MIAFIASFCLYFLYTMLIYSKVPSSLKIHFMYSAVNAILWGLPSYDLPYWVLLPLVFNSTRIELCNCRLMVHANNVPFALLKLLKNSLVITFLFHLSRHAKMSASLVLSILSIDIIQAISWEIKVIHYVNQARSTGK